MTSFLLWNINRKNLQRSIASLAWRYKVDVLMLAEVINSKSISELFGTPVKIERANKRFWAIMT